MMANRLAVGIVRAGRAAVFVVGLSVILALVFGVATTAVGATGGNFVLGKANMATTASKLTASVAGPALTLVNNSTEAAATALNISVAEGKAPIKVNASAGTATNLSADKIDGKDSSEFAAGVNGKATDADHADRADSAASAQSAANAQNADTLDGKDSAQFAQTGGFKAASVLDEGGALPKEGTFTSNGGTLLISAAGSGFRASGNTTTDSGLIGMRIFVDGQHRDYAYTYTNGADSHKAFVNDYLVVTNLAAGTHTIRLENWRADQFCGTASENNFDACTTTDSGDNFSVSVLEIPK